ncbi:MAG: hypothetical protein IKZ25_01570 [Clostridia bacterium]|nr:hypothetical protein [Clostridia bacterium]
MFDVYTVAFFGHRYIDNFLKIEKLLEKHIRNILNEKQYVDFLVGRNGDFDRIAASCVRRIQKNFRNDNSSLTLVLPYRLAEYANNEKYFQNYYSHIEISYNASISHPKSAIQIRNKEMVDRADLIIFYVEHNHGGAYKTLRYAIGQKKQFINLKDYIT